MSAPLLSRFSPGLMSPEDLEGMFVQREDLASRLVGLLRDSVLTEAKHHVLLVGPRGIGKTHLVALVRHRLRAMEDLEEHMAIAWLKEEEWGVGSLLDLLLRIIDALRADEPSLEGPQEGLYGLDPEEAESAAKKLLDDYLGERTLVVLAENLDDVFAGLGDVGQKRMRAHLQQGARWSLFATSQSLFGGVSLQSSPFYGFFHVHHLQELGEKEARELLLRIAQQRGDEELESFIHSPAGKARVDVLHKLAGGNHRLYVVMSDFLTRDELDELVEQFIRMLDDLTPYYQERMRYLTPQQRKILELMCEADCSLPVKDIARRGFLTHQTVSSQLKALKDLGYVKRKPIGRKSHYDLREPLMRLCVQVKHNRGEPIRLVVKTLKLVFSRDELKQRLDSLPVGDALARAYVEAALEDEADPRIRKLEKKVDEAAEEGQLAVVLSAIEELIVLRGAAADWNAKGECLYLLDRFEEAAAAFAVASEHEPVSNSTRALWALALSASRRPALAVQVLEGIDSAAVEPFDVSAVVTRACTSVGHFEEALHWADRAISLDERVPGPHFDRAHSLFGLGRIEEGMAALRTAIDTFVVGVEETGWDIDARLDLLFVDAVPALLPPSIEALESGRHVRELVELARQHERLVSIAGGLVASLYRFRSPDLGNPAARVWIDIWREHAERHRELMWGFRMVSAALRFRETRDRRILMELNENNRSIVLGLLGLDDGPDT